LGDWVIEKTKVNQSTSHRSKSPQVASTDRIVSEPRRDRSASVGYLQRHMPSPITDHKITTSLTLSIFPRVQAGPYGYWFGHVVIHSML